MFKSSFSRSLKRIVSSVLACVLVCGQNLAYAQSLFVSSLPEPGAMVLPSTSFVPVLAKGLVLHPDNPLAFDLIVDSGHDTADQKLVREQSERMAQYFLAAVTVPEDQLWVNLSPYEQDRIIENDLGRTVLGRDMLAQDYILKQLSASLIYPENGLGKEFWVRVYAQAREKFGTTSIPVDTFNKVWISPDKAEVYQNGNRVYITEARLKLMLDQDHQATGQTADVPDSFDSSARDLAKDMMRSVILPALEKEVNEGRQFAVTRQIYHAAILAKWYKEQVRNSLMESVYVGQNHVAGVIADEINLKEEIYQRYISAFKKGAFDYVKEEADTLTGEILPRKYFSGGFFDFSMKSQPLVRTRNAALLTNPVGKIFDLDFRLNVVTEQVQEPPVESLQLFSSTTDSAMRTGTKAVIGVLAILEVAALVVSSNWFKSEGEKIESVAENQIYSTGSVDRGLQITSSGVDTSYVPQDNDLYVNFSLKNIGDDIIPFSSAVGIAFDATGKARTVAVVSVADYQGTPSIASMHYTVGIDTPPEQISTRTIALANGVRVPLRIRIGASTENAAYILWHIDRFNQKASTFRINMSMSCQTGPCNKIWIKILRQLIMQCLPGSKGRKIMIWI
jgi:hypothetical protein